MSKNIEKNAKNGFGAGIELFIIPILFIIGLLFVWFGPSARNVDPWFEAVVKVDSASKVTDPALKSQLMEEGGKELIELVREFPKHARVHFMLGFYYMKSGKMDSAISEFRESIRIDSGSTINPVWMDAIKLLSNIYIAQSNDLIKNKMPEKALNKLREADDLSNFNENISAQFGVIFHQSGKLDSAEYYYRKALGINPNHKGVVTNLSLLYLLKGNELLQKGKFKKALEYYSVSYKVNNSNPDLLNNMAMAFMQTGENQKALEFFNAALKIKPDQINAIKNLSILYGKLGDSKTAEKYKNMYSNYKK